MLLAITYKLGDAYLPTLSCAAVGVIILIFILSYLSANAIPYQGGNDRSYIKRRAWWIVWTVLGALGYFICFSTVKFVDSDDTSVSLNQPSLYVLSYFIATVLVLLLSVGICVGVMKWKRDSKFGSILGGRK